MEYFDYTNLCTYIPFGILLAGFATLWWVTSNSLSLCKDTLELMVETEKTLTKIIKSMDRIIEHFEESRINHNVYSETDQKS